MPNNDPRGKLKLREAFERYYDVSEISNRGLEKFHTVLSRWERIMPEAPSLDAIDDRTMETFRIRCQEAGMRPSTINSYWTALRSIFRRMAPRWIGHPAGVGIAFQDGIPYMKPVRDRRGLPKRVPLDDITKFYIACRHADLPQLGIPPGELFRALVVTSYCTSFRRMDLLSMETANVDLDAGTYEFQAQKTGKADLWPLHPVVVDHLRRVWTPRRFVFPGFGKRGGWLTKLWKKIFDHTDLEKEDWFTLQDLRRTGAAEVDRVERGMGPVMLQHSARSVSDIFYLNRHDDLREAINKMRMPVGFKSGPAMIERQQKREREKRMKIHQRDIEVPGKPQPCEWYFHDRYFKLRDTWFRLHGKKWRLLQLLAFSEGPVGFDDIANIVYRNQPKPRDFEILHNRVTGVLAELRERLRKFFGLSDQYDPVPCVWTEDRRGCWTLFLPADAGKKPELRDIDLQPPTIDDELTPELLQRARRFAGLTQTELAGQTGFTQRTISAWEQGKRKIHRDKAQILKDVLARCLDGASKVKA